MKRTKHLYKLNCGCTKRKFRSMTCIKKDCVCKRKAHWHIGDNVTTNTLNDQFINDVIAKMPKAPRTNTDRIQDTVMFTMAIAILWFWFHSVGQNLLALYNLTW